MALKIRLRQQGRNNRPFFRIVVTDVRAPRDGKYVEALGWYNPFAAELDKNLSVNAERVQHWINFGAELSESLQTLISKVAPNVVRSITEKKVAHRAKRAAKRKARKQAEG
jgi:small subunit ribosomal protein S16